MKKRVFLLVALAVLARTQPGKKMYDDGPRAVDADPANPGITVTRNRDTTVIGLDSAIGATQGGSNDFSSSTNTYNGRFDFPCTNNPTTGTVNNTLARFDASGNCVLTSLADSSGAMGVVAVGGGNKGKARVAFQGPVNCLADASVTAGHYVVPGTVTAGHCGDSSARPPAGTPIIGTWITSGAAGTMQTLQAGLDRNQGASARVPAAVANRGNLVYATPADGAPGVAITDTMPPLAANKCAMLTMFLKSQEGNPDMTLQLAYGGTTWTLQSPPGIDSGLSIHGSICANASQGQARLVYFYGQDAPGRPAYHAESSPESTREPKTIRLKAGGKGQHLLVDGYTIVIP